MHERQRGPCVGVMTWKARGSWVQWRVKAVSWMRFHGCKVTRTELVLPLLPTHRTSASKVAGTPLRAEILCQLLHELTFKRRLVPVCAGDKDIQECPRDRWTWQGSQAPPPSLHDAPRSLIQALLPQPLAQMVLPFMSRSGCTGVPEARSEEGT